MFILSILVVMTILFVLILIIGLLITSHKLRFIDGYDTELENDYQAMIEQQRNRK